MKPIQTTRASEVIAELACLGAQLRIDGDHLRIRAPKGLLTRDALDGRLGDAANLLGRLQDSVRTGRKRQSGNLAATCPSR